MLKQFAQKTDLTHTENLSIILTILLFLLFLPIIVGLLYVFRRTSKQQQLRFAQQFLVSLTVFSVAVVLFGGLNYVINPITDSNIINEQAPLYWLFVLAFISSGFGIFGSAVQIIANRLRQ